MKINADTKIATLLKHHPDALEAIVRLSPKFGKLRNPLLRKLLAGRTTIAMASKIGGCKVEDFFGQLRPLGFEPGDSTLKKSDRQAKPPHWLQTRDKQKIKELDVRPVLDAGKDPLKQLLGALKNLPAGHVLKVINTFEPMPLILLVGKKGFSSYVEPEEDDLVMTYFYRESSAQEAEAALPEREGEDWEGSISRFKDHLIQIDVRDLPMPQPMMTILDAVGKLSWDQALFVEHKKLPVFLLPELRERGFDYRLKEIDNQHVQLLIFRDERD